MANQTRWVFYISHELAKQGWAFRQGKRHVMFYPADKTKKPFTISSTPSDNYARNQAVRQLQKAGADLSNIKDVWGS